MGAIVMAITVHIIVMDIHAHHITTVIITVAHRIIVIIATIEVINIMVADTTVAEGIMAAVIADTKKIRLK